MRYDTPNTPFGVSAPRAPRFTQFIFNFIFTFLKFFFRCFNVFKAYVIVYRGKLDEKGYQNPKELGSKNHLQRRTESCKNVTENARTRTA